MFTDVNEINPTNYTNSTSILPAESLLVWSVTAKRINSSHEMSHLKFTDSYVRQSVTPRDQEIADDIIRYYSKKIQILLLKGQPLSRFREDLRSFLCMGPDTLVDPKYFGMIYSLPFFYDYDMKIDGLFNQYGTLTSEVHGQAEQELHPVIRLKTPSALRHVYEYWFYRLNKDNLPELVKTKVQKDNTFRPMMDHIITSNKPLKVKFTKYNVFKEDQRKSFIDLTSFILV